MNNSLAPKIKAIVYIVYGIQIITELCNVFPGFISRITSTDKRKVLFKQLFQNHLYEHLADKEWTNFGHRYLNLDTDCQQRLLRHLISMDMDLTMPVIKGWKDLAKKYYHDGELDQEDVRNVCVGFGDRTKWEVYPEPMVWISKFLLYANNHSIDGQPPLFIKEADWDPWDAQTQAEFNAYQGDKYGNADNWALWWNQASLHAKTMMCQRLINY